MDVLKVEGISKRFGTHTVIEELSFSVKEHSVFGFIGKNGAGKTTTMKMILGLLAPDQGQIQVCGETVHYGETKTNRYIGYLPDVPEFYGYMTPTEYLALCGKITGMNKKETKERSKEVLQLVGLQDANKRIAGFSRGMKQRLGIAQALLNKPRLLICDEPTSALDPIGRKEILDILSIVKEHTTVIFSTHILSDVERICDSVGVLNDGKLQLQGKLADIKYHRAQDVIKVAFGLEKDNRQQTMIDQIEKLQGVSSVVEENGEYLIRVKDRCKDGETILEYVVANHLPLIKYEVQETTLEDIFLEVVE